ncbi:MAG TPA: transglycosylase domain-containing protein [Firmicutes bacterium]|nr:transglycosylase domain-containing protein [Bacillota bacterium]
MYRDAVEEVPISEKVASIRSTSGFTEYEDLPTLYVEAVISVEDKRFWSHHGVDYLAIARAAWNDVRSLSFVEGGSTITQQLMKNQYFTQDKNFERKFAEIFAAWDMERAYTKEEIFELYVNTIYFGSGYYGIHDAAQGYFGKDPAGLTESEAVMLAGLPNAPSVYSLDANPALARQRMRQVLDSMVDCGAISQTESDRIFAGA